MSSKNWLAQNLPPSLKKIASTEEFSTMDKSSAYSSSLSFEDEEEKEERRKEIETTGHFDIWSSIQSNKATDSDPQLNTPYIHPLVKRSSSSLSEKSLQICTESLGSETGSDRFSESGDDDSFLLDGSNEEEENKEQVIVQDRMQDEKKELAAVNYNCSISRKSHTRCFPPPLPSISRREGPCIQMKTHRKDGRLVIEAVPVLSHNYLHAHRQGGRLRLSFVNSPSSHRLHAHIQEEFKEEEVEEAKDEEEIEVVVGKGIVLGMKVKQEEVMKVPQPTLLMNKLLGSMHAMHHNNPNPWVLHDDKDEPRCVSTIQAAAAFNGYDRFWKSRPMVPPNNKLVVTKKRTPLVLKAEDFLPAMRCMKPRRPLLVWEHFCVATT